MAVNQSNIIETQDLTVRFGGKAAVDRLTLEVPRRSVFALLGQPGAGKSSLLRALMNVLRPSAGTATVMDVPSTALDAAAFERIGYVDGERPFPEWMKPEDLLAYCRPYYPAWDDAYGRDLLARFRIPCDRKIKFLEEEAKAKLALLVSLAYRPSLLLLDDPFRDLDTAGKNESIAAILDVMDQEEWSVVLTSSNVDDVERLADWIGVIHEGKLEFAESIGSLKKRFRLVEAIPVDRREMAGEIPDTWLDVKMSEHWFRFVDSRYEEGQSESTVRSVLGDTCSFEVTPVPLREIYRVLGRTYGLSL